MAVDPEHSQQEASTVPSKEETRPHQQQEVPKHQKGAHDARNILPLDERMKQFRDMMLERGVGVTSLTISNVMSRVIHTPISKKFVTAKGEEQ